MGYPAGLKLNGSLSRFLGLMYHWLVNVWSGVLDQILQHSLAITMALALTTMLLGASFLVAALIDLLRIMTFHVRFCHFLASRMFCWEVRVLRSLFYLFRGKKWNMLKERLDSADYDLDQLLLGTILFACLVFLFPTVAVYYALFTTSSLAVMAVGCVGEGVLLLFSHTPIYELLIRQRVAGEKGVRVEAGRLILGWKARDASATLAPLLGRLKRQVTMYFGIRTLLPRLLTGQPLLRLARPDADLPLAVNVKYSDYQTISDYYYKIN